MKKYFGTDGIRGQAYSFLSMELAYKVGVALKTLGLNEVVIGYDTRESSLDIMNAITNGAFDSNLKVLNAGVIPTPGLCLNSRQNENIAVMITASHNPYQDNGIKIFYKGYKLNENQKATLEKFINNYNEEINLKNLIIPVDNDIKNEYVKFLRQMYVGHSKVKVAIDCANGAASFIAREVFNDKLNDLFIRNDIPNGKNINENCGATKPCCIVEATKNNGCDLGISLDGDADRLVVCDSEGNVYRGDELSYIFANYLKVNNQLRGDKIILTTMSNLGLINSLKENQIDVLTVNVGDENIIHAMIDNDISYGAEEAGHIIFGDILRTGDGILSAIMLLMILNETKLNLKELTRNLTMYPTLLRNIREIDKNHAKDERLIQFVADVNEKLGSTGFLMVRASGTEELIRVSCCARDEKMVNEYVNDVVKILENCR